MNFKHFITYGCLFAATSAYAPVCESANLEEKAQNSDISTTEKPRLIAFWSQNVIPNSSMQILREIFYCDPSIDLDGSRDLDLKELTYARGLVGKKWYESLTKKELITGIEKIGRYSK